MKTIIALALAACIFAAPASAHIPPLCTDAVMVYDERAQNFQNHGLKHLEWAINRIGDLRSDAEHKTDDPDFAVEEALRWIESHTDYLRLLIEYLPILHGCIQRDGLPPQ